MPEGIRYTPEMSPGHPEQAAEFIQPPSALQLVQTLLGETRKARVVNDRTERIEAQQLAFTAGVEFWALPPAVRRPGAAYLRKLGQENPDNINLLSSLVTLHDARKFRREHMEHARSLT